VDIGHLLPKAGTEVVGQEAKGLGSLEQVGRAPETTAGTNRRRRTNLPPSDGFGERWFGAANEAGSLAGGERKRHRA